MNPRKQRYIIWFFLFKESNSELQMTSVYQRILKSSMKRNHGILEYTGSVIDKRKDEYLLDVEFVDDGLTLAQFLSAVQGNNTKNMRYYFREGNLHLLAFWLYHDTRGHGRDYNPYEAFDKLNECYEELSRVMGRYPPLNLAAITGLRCPGEGSGYCGESIKISYTYDYEGDDFDIFSADWNARITGVRCVCRYNHLTPRRR